MYLIVCIVSFESSMHTVFPTIFIIACSLFWCVYSRMYYNVNWSHCNYAYCSTTQRPHVYKCKNLMPSKGYWLEFYLFVSDYLPSCLFHHILSCHFVPSHCFVTSYKFCVPQHVLFCHILLHHFVLSNHIILLYCIILLDVKVIELNSDTRK